MNQIADAWSRTTPDDRAYLQSLVAQQWVQAAYGKQQVLVELARKDLDL